MTERAGVITLLGNPVTLVGETPSVGDKAPDFSALNNDLSEFSLSSLAGKTVVLLTVPSLDTPVCDTEVRKFNEAAAGLGEAVEIVVASVDLPFAQARWCGAAGVDRVRTVSDHRDLSVGNRYGVLIKEARLLARAALVIDADGTVVHSQIVPEVGDEPDYDAILDAVKRA